MSYNGSTAGGTRGEGSLQRLIPNGVTTPTYSCGALSQARQTDKWGVIRVVRLFRPLIRASREKPHLNEGDFRKKEVPKLSPVSICDIPVAF
jgi:hypothetical protein